MTLANMGTSGGTTPCGVALLVIALLAGCGGPPGYIVNALPDTSFVESPEQRYLFSEEQGGWLMIGLNGQIHRRLFGVEYHIKDISSDGQTLVLRNTDTDLFIARDGGREIREVPEFRGRLGNVGLSPDGRFVAATKHADYRQPQSEWVDDERLYLIDAATLRVREVGRFEVPDGRPPLNLVWPDDHHVLLTFFSGRGEQIDVRTGDREVFPDGLDRLHRSQRWMAFPEDRAGCGMEIRVPDLRAGKGGIDVVRPGEPPRRLVKIEGALPPHPHRLGDGISNPSFTRDCRYITFDFHSELWVAEIASGRVGPILPDRHFVFERWYPIGLP